MHSHLFDRIAEAADRARMASSGRALEDAVQQFIEVLQCVPDYPLASLPPESLRIVRARADDVITSIERWVASHNDQGYRERRLVERVYDIRRSLEYIHRWCRHAAHA